MGNKEFAKLAVDAVVTNLNFKVEREDIYIVWLVKVLQNNKALLSTNKSDGLYFEVTYNGDKKEVYVDRYIKEKNCMYDVDSGCFDYE